MRFFVSFREFALNESCVSALLQIFAGLLKGLWFLNFLDPWYPTSSYIPTFSSNFHLVFMKATIFTYKTRQTKSISIYFIIFPTQSDSIVVVPAVMGNLISSHLIPSLWEPDERFIFFCRKWDTQHNIKFVVLMESHLKYFRMKATCVRSNSSNGGKKAH